MHIKRPTPPPRLISLVPMIDVLLIMLVFFMVTSTYLNLDMIPVARSSEQGAPPPADGAGAVPLMIRLGADGQPYLRGQPVSYGALSQMLAGMPEGQSVMILPSLRADTQALVTLMDVATTAGIRQLRVLQVAAP